MMYIVTFTNSCFSISFSCKILVFSSLSLVIVNSAYKETTYLLALPHSLFFRHVPRGHLRHNLKNSFNNGNLMSDTTWYPLNEMYSIVKNYGNKEKLLSSIE